MRSEDPTRAADDSGRHEATAWSELASARFLRYGLVGASGVVVNLGALFVLAEIVNLHPNLASALAIETSMLTNFALHERWTFADRRGRVDTWARRLLRFHVVSGAGAFVQWGVFVTANATWAAFGGAVVLDGPVGGSTVTGWLPAWISAPVDTGAFKYAAQTLGIAAAMLWNFFANLRYTWALSPPEDQSRPAVGEEADRG